MGSTLKAIPSAVAPSADNTVPVNDRAQRGPYKPMTGKAVLPVVPRTEQDGEPDSQPRFGNLVSHGGPPGSPVPSAPTVPADGYLYAQGPIDPHYQDKAEARNSYAKVNNPPTRGMLTFIKDYLNHIAYSQNRTPDGFKINGPQQRTSVMRVTPPPHGAGYAPQTYVPHQLPQRDNTAKFMPATGTDRYGTGVLNSDILGAGQTAGGIGGNQYTPAPGPPDTTSTAGQPSQATGMPRWG